ncbi:MAG: CHAT domain-containing protein [Deltaproteobacteria bacterium]|nr:CHAT domain-containing protein [Deltaproteobacteria bacterium]
MKTNIEDIKISSLMQKKQHHELIRTLQPALDKNEPLSSFRTFLLAAAYYEIRDYEKMFRTADLLERQIGKGDVAGYGGNLSVYPYTLRGFAYLDQGVFDKALAEASKAAVILDRDAKNDNTFYRTQLIDISCIAGIASAEAGRMKDADRHIKTIEDVTTIGGILGPEKYVALARIHMAKRDYQSALSAVQNPRAGVLGLYTVFYDQTFQELPKYFILVKCLYETGKVEEAKKGYDQLLGHPQMRQIGGLLWPALLDRARIARREGDVKRAEELLKEAVEVIEKQRASINTETGRIGYVGDKQDVYRELIALLCGGNRAAEAFEYVERAKGRALVDLLAAQTKIAVRGKNAENIDRTLSRLTDAEKASATVADVKMPGDVAGTRGVVLKLKKELQAQDPELASITTVTDTDVKSIQSRLNADESILEYFETDEAWYAFVLSRNHIRVTAINGAGLADDVADFRQKLTRAGKTDYMARAKALYGKLFAPVAGQLATPRLIIVPHGVLHYLPFNALHSGKEFLLDRYQLRILPSASILGILADRAGTGRRSALIMGNPDLKNPSLDLKYAGQEAIALGKIIPQATVLLRNNARADVIRDKGHQYGILHFAVHGVFDAENPLNSALLLAGNGSGQGLLKAGDLYQLRLNSDLITLSACETALSVISKGDDVIGFTRGFLYAGARSIVSSLWQVDDEATRDLMVGFYQRLPRMDNDKALREAQLQVKKGRPHPFYWAAFQLTGLPK